MLKQLLKKISASDLIAFWIIQLLKFKNHGPQKKLKKWFSRVFFYLNLYAEINNSHWKTILVKKLQDGNSKWKWN